MGLIMELLNTLLGDNNKITKSLETYADSYDDSYGRSSERYENMSDSQLEREIQRLKNMSGYDAKRMGKLAALKEEYDRRH